LKNVIFLGLVSFFTDLSTEMIYPLVPIYLTTAFGATPALVGFIEGIAESVASLVKVFSGYITDRSQKKRSIAFLGYSTGLIYKISLIIANSWVGILGARVADRIGKGIRTAPRDVLVSESAGSENMGKAFGLHKALDMSGAAIGVLITFFLLKGMSDGYNFKSIFALSMIPAVLGLCMFLFIKQKRVYKPKTIREPFWKNIKSVNGQLKLYLFIVLLFTLGNSSNAFLLLKASHVGFDPIDVILLYLVYNITASILSLPFGKLSDSIGRKNLLVPGYIVFSICYIGFAVASNQLTMIAMFIVFGIYTAMITGVERAYVAEISPKSLVGTMLGLQSTIIGIALLPASIIAGLLWNSFGPAVPFLFGASMSAVAAILLILYMKNPSKSQVQ